jgi:S1-C subfamily serine protease
MNKVIVAILIVLVIISGGLGYYSYTLNQQMYALSDSLNQQLFDLQVEQANQTAEIDQEFATVRAEMTAQTGNVESKIDETRNEIGALQGQIAGTGDRIDSLESKIGSATAQVSELVIDGSEVYKKVAGAAVRISDGNVTIGSGFIFDNDSHVVTAQHVVERLTTVYVTTPDGQVSRASKVSGSTYSDVAVLTLEKKFNIEPLPIVDSSKVQVGDPVAAIGNPFDLNETLTTGIVSGLNRFGRIEYDTQSRWIANLIQFDAAVNFGNSGGMLVNSRGVIIGLVIARVNPDEGDGVNWAVSSNKMKKVAAALIANGNDDYPWLGVEITDLSARTVLNRGLQSASGVLIERPGTGSPAETAGLKAGDVIIAVDGAAVKDVGEFTSYLGENKSPGDKLRLTMVRGSSQIEVTVDIGKRP